MIDRDLRGNLLSTPYVEQLHPCVVAEIGLHLSSIGINIFEVAQLMLSVFWICSITILYEIIEQSLDEVPLGFTLGNTPLRGQWLRDWNDGRRPLCTP